MGSLPPVPNLNVQPPQIPNTINLAGQVLSLRSLLNQQALQQGQQTLQQQEIQRGQMTLQDQQTLRSLQGQFVQKDDSGKPIGYDWNGLINAAQGKVMPQTLFQLQQQQATMRQAMATATKDELANQETLNSQLYQRAEGLKEITDPAQRQTHYQDTLQWAAQHGVNVQAWPAQAPDNDHLNALESEFGMHAQALKDAQTKAETASANAKTTQEQAETQKLNQETAFYGKMGLPPGITPEMAGYAAYIQKGGTPENYAAYKAAQEAKATAPYKIEQSIAEGKARQMIQGMTEPVYAYLPNGQKQLMSKTEALQGGVRTMVPVSETAIANDTMLINRLSDVRQKIAQYEQSLQKPVSAKDKGNMAALLDQEHLKGPFGIEFPTGRFDAALNAENLRGLSPNARDQLVAYRNAREALVGYNRVLSGSGKSSDTSLQLNEQTMPDPSITDRDYSARSIGAFKQNLEVVGQGLPKIPGVSSPEEWERQVTQPQGGFGRPVMNGGSVADFLRGMR